MFILHYSFVTFCLRLFNAVAATYETIIAFVNVPYFSVTYNCHFCLVTMIRKLFFFSTEHKWKNLSSYITNEETP